VVAVVAVLITVFTRGRLAYEPKHAARPAPESHSVEPAA
jgi:hypothetical protein